MKIRTEIHENRAQSFVAMKHAARGSVRVLDDMVVLVNMPIYLLIYLHFEYVQCVV